MESDRIQTTMRESRFDSDCAIRFVTSYLLSLILKISYFFQGGLDGRHKKYNRVRVLMGKRNYQNDENRPSQRLWTGDLLLPRKTAEQKQKIVPNSMFEHPKQLFL